jgi:hypothetical protein
MLSNMQAVSASKFFVQNNRFFSMVEKNETQPDVDKFLVNSLIA